MLKVQTAWYKLMVKNLLDCPASWKILIADTCGNGGHIARQKANERLVEPGLGFYNNNLMRTNQGVHKKSITPL